MDQKSRRRLQRGFTLIELMLVVVIIGVLSSLAIPFYTKASARAYRSESQVVLNKLELYFRNTYQNGGTFLGPSIIATPDVMPDPTGTLPVGRGVDWKPVQGHGWDDVPFPPQGDIRMRYTYSAITATSVTLVAYGQFPGFGASVGTLSNGQKYNYSFAETLVATPNGVVVDDSLTVVFPATGVNAKGGQTDF
jgi:prepilin-type N-terminal cleavage/methylation domain-containing protein